MRVLYVALAGLFAFCCAVLLFSAPGAAEGPASDKALESVLLAPCCYNGTLVSHDSELAHQLRGEIESRYAHGEPTQAIEADMVARYGPQVKAMPNQTAFVTVAGFAAAAAAFGALALALTLRRWRRDGGMAAPDATAEGGARAGAAAPVRVRDAYDDRIDAELLEAD